MRWRQPDESSHRLWYSPRAVKWLEKGSLTWGSRVSFLPHQPWVAPRILVFPTGSEGPRGQWLGALWQPWPPCHGPHPIPLALALNSWLKPSLLGSSLTYYFSECYIISPLGTFILEWRSRHLTELKTQDSSPSWMRHKNNSHFKGGNINSIPNTFNATQESKNYI